MSLNCSSTRLAIISTNNIFKLFDIRDNGTQVVPSFEKKDIWDMKWDTDKEDTIAIMEKSRLLVVQGIIAADPVPNHGYICSFRDLTVRTIQMQYVMQNPKDFDRGLISDIEVKVMMTFFRTLRKAKELLDAGKISEANVFIEQNSHPMLW
uniref:IFT121 second beta-propeller domain-containing protein n=1 Tax=Panagrolaimus superbus TaxID=310955 RepID=A0A914YY19_9BILA